MKIPVPTTHVPGDWQGAEWNRMEQEIHAKADEAVAARIVVHRLWLSRPWLRFCVWLLGLVYRRKDRDLAMLLRWAAEGWEP